MHGNRRKRLPGKPLIRVTAELLRSHVARQQGHTLVRIHACQPDESQASCVEHAIIGSHPDSHHLFIVDAQKHNKLATALQIDSFLLAPRPGPVIVLVFQCAGAAADSAGVTVVSAADRPFACNFLHAVPDPEWFRALLH